MFKNYDSEYGTTLVRLFYDFITETEENKGEIVKVTKDDIKTYICDGAKLTCPNMLAMNTQISFSPTQPVSGGITLNVLNEKALLMGIDPIATEKDINDLNFASYDTFPEISILSL